MGGQMDRPTQILGILLQSGDPAKRAPSTLRFLKLESQSKLSDITISNIKKDIKKLTHEP